MTIEVKQLIIRSQVTRDVSAGDRGPDQGSSLNSAELRKWRAALLKECRELVAEQLRDRKER